MLPQSYKFSRGLCLKIFLQGVLPANFRDVRFFSSAFFAHFSPSLINISTIKFPWNKTYKTTTFTGITPDVTILTMLEAIRTSQDGMMDKESGNIVA